MSIRGSRRFVGSCASGTMSLPAPFLGRHWCAPAGDFISSHSYAKRMWKNSLSHRVGW